MSVVTITRQYGAGGSLVARHVAGALGWTVIDNEFVGEVAKLAGLPPEEVAAREERAPSLLERLARTLAVSALHRVTERVIAEAAAQGRVVLVGRGATAYLATAGERAQAVHAYVVAPKGVRVATIVARFGLSEAEAVKAVHDTDAARERYWERFYARRRDDVSNYHVVVNTAWLGYEGAAGVIVDAARRLSLR